MGCGNSSLALLPSHPLTACARITELGHTGVMPWDTGLPVEEKHSPPLPYQPHLTCLRDGLIYDLACFKTHFLLQEFYSGFSKTS